MAKAKALCNGAPGRPATKRLPEIEAQEPCPVLAECREWALETRFPHGIIGGLSERERKRILKELDDSGE